MNFVVIRLNRVVVGVIGLVLFALIGTGLFQLAKNLGGHTVLRTTTGTVESNPSSKQPQTETTPPPSPPQDIVAEATAALDAMLAVRAKALQTGDTTGLPALYDTTTNTGRWALEHQERRIGYVAAWSAKRQLKLVESAVSFRIVRAKPKVDAVWMYVIQSSSFGYVYNGESEVNRFGIGTRHVMELKRRGDRWVFRKDWFTDPLDEDTLIPDVLPALGDPEWATAIEVMRKPLPLDEITRIWLAEKPTDDELEFMPTTGGNRRYNRAAALAYADKYCGAAVGCGNNNRYNPRYDDYTGLGGDCTNFVSQVLGDPEGGALPNSSTWRSSRKGGGGAGSTAWVQTDSFGHYLAYSGIGTRIARSTYEKVVKPTAENPLGLVGSLQSGDVIGYQEKGDLVHFAIITAKDSRGVPLVNSHTADRYHVPWDLGWDRKTVYWLYRMRD